MLSLIVYLSSLTFTILFPDVQSNPSRSRRRLEDDDDDDTSHQPRKHSKALNEKSDVVVKRIGKLVDKQIQSELQDNIYAKIDEQVLEPIGEIFDNL